MDRPEALESDYYQHQNFDPEHAHRVRSFYLQFVKGREFLVELGCGRGEFLRDAKQTVNRVLGVDHDPGMVEATRSQGLEALQVDVSEYLETTTDQPDAIFAAHLIEHFSVDDSLDLIGAAKKLLKPGGVIVLVTPNPQCLSIMLNDFWNDPTHVRPYTLSLVEFMVKQCGFELVSSGLNPMDEPGPPPELLAPETLEPWAPFGPSELDTQFHGEIDVGNPEVNEKLNMLLKMIYEVNHAISLRGQAWDSRIDQIRHQAQVATTGLNEALRHLYGPNELFIVGRSPA